MHRNLDFHHVQVSIEPGALQNQLVSGELVRVGNEGVVPRDVEVRQRPAGLSTEALGLVWGGGTRSHRTCRCFTEALDLVWEDVLSHSKQRAVPEPDSTLPSIIHLSQMYI